MHNPLAQLLRVLRFLLCQLLSNLSDLVDGARNAPPGICLQRWVTLPVEAKMGIVLAFYKPVASFQFVPSPWLYRQRLVEIVIVSHLLIGILDLRLHCIGGGKGP